MLAGVSLVVYLPSSHLVILVGHGHHEYRERLHQLPSGQGQCCPLLRREHAIAVTSVIILRNGWKLYNRLFGERGVSSPCVSALSYIA